MRESTYNRIPFFFLKKSQERPSNMKTAIIVQARMGSTRLPGKVLKTVLGKPLLEFLVERLARSKLADGFLIATTTNPADDPIAKFCQEKNIPYFRGSEENVLERFYQTAKKYNVENIVRITADCPLMDPQVIDDVLHHFLTHKEYKIVINTPENEKKRTYPRGLDVEIFGMDSLTEAYQKANDPFEKEHVTPYLRRRAERFPVACVHYKEKKNEYRLTVDTDDDFIVVKNVIETLYPAKPEFTLKDIFEILDKHPEWNRLNQNVSQLVDQRLCDDFAQKD